VPKKNRSNLKCLLFIIKRDDYSLINIDFAPIGSFEAFMNNEPIPLDEE
jgi:hypothetical protein